MSLEVTGKLHEIYPTQQIKENFSKREFVIEITDESPSGMVFTNYAAFQLINNNCSVIDQFHVGDNIKVNFNIRGNRWERDGNVKYITNLNAWRVERAQEGNQQPAAPAYQQPQQQGGSQAQSQPFQNNQGGDDSDLPF
jgi:hypothetical protein